VSDGIILTVYLAGVAVAWPTIAVLLLRHAPFPEIENDDVDRVLVSVIGLLSAIGWFVFVPIGLVVALMVMALRRFAP